MASLGSVMVIKRDGKDGGCLRLRKKKCIIGRNLDCDIRIQLPNVDAQHAELFLDDDSQMWLRNVSSAEVCKTLLNGAVLERNQCEQIASQDIFQIGDRMFRLELPTHFDASKKCEPSEHKSTATTSTDENKRDHENMMATQRSATPKCVPKSRSPPRKSTGNKTTALPASARPSTRLQRSVRLTPSAPRTTSPLSRHTNITDSTNSLCGRHLLSELESVSAPAQQLASNSTSTLAEQQSTQVPQSNGTEAPAAAAPRRALPTPLRKAIAHHTRGRPVARTTLRIETPVSVTDAIPEEGPNGIESEDEGLSLSQVPASQSKRSTSAPVHVQLSAKGEQATRRALPTPLRNAICTRPPQAKEQRRALPTPLRKDIANRESKVRRALPTPLRKDIANRESKVRRVLPTPLRNDIAKRASASAACPVVEERTSAPPLTAEIIGKETLGASSSTPNPAPSVRIRQPSRTVMQGKRATTPAAKEVSSNVVKSTGKRNVRKATTKMAKGDQPKEVAMETASTRQAENEAKLQSDNEDCDSEMSTVFPVRNMMLEVEFSSTRLPDTVPEENEAEEPSSDALQPEAEAVVCLPAVQCLRLNPPSLSMQRKRERTGPKSTVAILKSTQKQAAKKLRRQLMKQIRSAAVRREHSIEQQARIMASAAPIVLEGLQTLQDMQEHLKPETNQAVHTICESLELLQMQHPAHLSEHVHDPLNMLSEEQSNSLMESFATLMTVAPADHFLVAPVAESTPAVDSFPSPIRACRDSIDTIFDGLSRVAAVFTPHKRSALLSTPATPTVAAIAETVENEISVPAQAVKQRTPRLKGQAKTPARVVESNRWKKTNKRRHTVLSADISGVTFVAPIEQANGAVTIEEESKIPNELDLTDTNNACEEALLEEEKVESGPNAVSEYEHAGEVDGAKTPEAPPCRSLKTPVSTRVLRSAAKPPSKMSLEAPPAESATSGLNRCFPTVLSTPLRNDIKVASSAAYERRAAKQAKTVLPPELKRDIVDHQRPARVKRQLPEKLAEQIAASQNRYPSVQAAKRLSTPLKKAIRGGISLRPAPARHLSMQVIEENAPSDNLESESSEPSAMLAAVTESAEHTVELSINSGIVETEEDEEEKAEEEEEEAEEEEAAAEEEKHTDAQATEESAEPIEVERVVSVLDGISEIVSLTEDASSNTCTDVVSHLPQGAATTFEVLATEHQNRAEESALRIRDSIICGLQVMMQIATEAPTVEVAELEADAHEDGQISQPTPDDLSVVVVEAESNAPVHRSDEQAPQEEKTEETATAAEAATPAKKGRATRGSKRGKVQPEAAATPPARKARSRRGAADVAATETRTISEPVEATPKPTQERRTRSRKSVETETVAAEVTPEPLPEAVDPEAVVVAAQTALTPKPAKANAKERRTRAKRSAEEDTTQLAASVVEESEPRAPTSPAAGQAKQQTRKRAKKSEAGTSTVGRVPAKRHARKSADDTEGADDEEKSEADADAEIETVKARSRATRSAAAEVKKPRGAGAKRSRAADETQETSAASEGEPAAISPPKNRGRRTAVEPAGRVTRRRAALMEMN